jgi:hypothetical protein
VHPRAARRLLRLRHAEVDELHAPAVEHDDVARRDVVVDQLEPPAVARLELVRRVQALGGVGDHARDRQRIEARAAPARDPQHLEQRLTGEVLHHDEVAARFGAELVDLDDVRVLDQPGVARLVGQHLGERRLRRQVLVHELDDDELLEARRSTLGREVDLGRPTSPDRRDQLVATERDRARLGLPQCRHGVIVSRPASSPATPMRVGLLPTLAGPAWPGPARIGSIGSPGRGRRGSPHRPAQDDCVGA